MTSDHDYPILYFSMNPPVGDTESCPKKKTKMFQMMSRKNRFLMNDLKRSKIC